MSGSERAAQATATCASAFARLREDSVHTEDWESDGERQVRILLQTSIAHVDDDWNVGRFSLLAEHMRSFADVTARNRQADAAGNDPVLAGLSRDRFDEVWLLGVDGGVALSEADCAGVNRFHGEVGGLLTTREHRNMGLWRRRIEGVGDAHFFHETRYAEPDPARCCADDQETPSISWPNYHSGRNGDFQLILAVEPRHPLLQPDLRYFPAHPHEGAIGVPARDPRARTVARGRSLASGREFDLVVAFDRTAEKPGRAIAESSFHHFADYNWSPELGAPSFVSEPPGDEVYRHPERMKDIRAYVRNAAEWLAPAGS